MKAVKVILSGLLLLFGGLYIVGLFLPDNAHIERTIEISAPQEKVFLLLNGFQEFNQWSPWYDLDPDAEYIYEGPQKGVGARIAWKSDSPAVGAGSQEIIRSIPYRRIDVQFDFGLDGTAIVRYDINTTGSVTSLTWSLETEFGGQIVSRYFGLIFDSLVGPDYERGLNNFKRLVESQESDQGSEAS